MTILEDAADRLVLEEYQPRWGAMMIAAGLALGVVVIADPGGLPDLLRLFLALFAILLPVAGVDAFARTRIEFDRDIGTVRASRRSLVRVRHREAMLRDVGDAIVQRVNNPEGGPSFRAVLKVRGRNWRLGDSYGSEREAQEIQAAIRRFLTNVQPGSTGGGAA